MKADIEIINLLKFNSEKAGEGTRLNFRMLGTGYLSKSTYLKGYENLDCYYSNHDVFEKVPETFLGAKVSATFISDPNNTNPLRDRKVIESLECNGQVIQLV